MTRLQPDTPPFYTVDQLCAAYQAQVDRGWDGDVGLHSSSDDAGGTAGTGRGGGSCRVDDPAGRRGGGRMMQIRPIRNDADLVSMSALMERRARPFTVTITDGLPRSTHQNRLQRKWCTEVSEQLGDRTPEQVRGYMKLHHGIPIRREDPEFDAAYRDRIIGLTYEMKMALMMEPFDLAVTRDMTRKQLSRYLDAVMGDFTQQGVVLTMPEASA